MIFMLRGLSYYDKGVAAFTSILSVRVGLYDLQLITDCKS
jgi:hypothetical protein